MPKDSKDTAIYVAYDDQEPFDASRPEKELLRAILMNAMSDLKRSGEVGRQAKAYFLSPDDGYLFAFQSVCRFLDVDPNTILVVTGLKEPRTWTRAPSSPPREIPEQADSDIE